MNTMVWCRGCGVEGCGVEGVEDEGVIFIYLLYMNMIYWLIDKLNDVLINRHNLTNENKGILCSKIRGGCKAHTDSSGAELSSAAYQGAGVGSS